MRTIRFRGKCQRGFDYSNGTGWVYGSLLTNGKECGIVKEEDIDLSGRSDDGIQSIEDFAAIPVIPETVGQFTCVIDKSGKEVYEGDVIICREFSNTSGLEMTEEERNLFSLEELKGEKREENVMLVTADGVSLIAETEFGPNGSSGTWMDVMDEDQRHSFPIHEVEVLGNIHDNPKLFKTDNHAH